jgi:hypothetical protein
MTAAELRNLLAAVDADTPVILWDDVTGRSGDASYTTSTDGQLTICGRLS